MGQLLEEGMSVAQRSKDNESAFDFNIPQTNTLLLSFLTLIK